MTDMRKYLASQKIPSVDITKPHIRWASEPVPGDRGKSRLNLVVVDRNPRRLMENVLGQIRQVGYAEQTGLTFEGRVKEKGLPFIFESYETNVDPSVQVNWTQFGTTKRDSQLVVKKGHPDNLTAYVSGIYVGKP